MILKSKRGLILILSSPSGAGKTTLAKKIERSDRNFKISVSYTTRTPRTNEVDGVDYNFVTIKKFQELASQDKFLEQAHSFKPACEACGQAECGCEAVSEGDYGNSPEVVTASSDMMVNALSGGLNGPKQQSNPNNPGDNPIAMPRLGQHSSPNLNLGIQKDEKEINEEVERGLRELYKRYRT